MISTNGHPGPLVPPVSRALRPRPESTGAPARRKPRHEEEPGGPDEMPDDGVKTDEAHEHEKEPHPHTNGPLGQNISRLV